MRGEEWGLCAQEGLRGHFFSFKSKSWQSHLECVSSVGGTASPVGGHGITCREAPERNSPRNAKFPTPLPLAQGHCLWYGPLGFLSFMV